MKKIGILTYHTGYNYGASLQAYALQTTIQKFQQDCEIINFETERFLASREMFSRKPTRVKDIIKMITRIPYYKSLKKRQRLFDDYTNKCLLTSNLYRTEKEVIEHVKEYDCIVCGSDQIWNLDESDACAANPIYFLNFEKSQKRVSYAASFGKWVKKAPNYEEVFLPWIKKFDMVSVRETSGVEYLRSKSINCDLVLDPTLLLDVDEYSKICSEPIIKGKYVLMFSWNCHKDVLSASKMVSKQLGIKLINIVPPPRAMLSGIERKLDIGPSEFLSLIKNAEFIVTNSFHGTVFSTIYKKPYVSILSGEPDTRIKSLLSQLGLDNNLVMSKDIKINKVIETDYSLVNDKMQQLRHSSLQFLKKAIEV